MSTTTDPKQALSAEELAQVRADLELVEPKVCDQSSRADDIRCGKPAVAETIQACGMTHYRCQSCLEGPFVLSPSGKYFCSCGWRSADPLGHRVAVLPL